MKNKSTLTLGAKLWLLSGSLLAILLGLSGFSFWTIKELNQQLTEVSTIDIPAVRNQTLADMMHDGIRANAFHAIIVSGSKDAAEIKEVREESEEFAKNIKSYIETLNGLNLPEKVKAAIAPSLPLIDGYVKSAHEVVELALAGKPESALKHVPDLQEKFSALEKQFDTLGKTVE